MIWRRFMQSVSPEAYLKSLPRAARKAWRGSQGDGETVQRPEEERDVTRVQKSYQPWAGALLICLILLSGVALAAERSTGEVVDDAMVTTKVKASFAADPQVSALAIDVDTVNGVVTLTGVVENDTARQRAIQLAQGIDGVQRVEATNLHVKR
jgi:hypothetical protein